MSRFLAAIIVLVLIGVAMTGCVAKVPYNHVGVKVNTWGGDRGVQNEALAPGWYWVGFAYEMHSFPTFQQNYVWQNYREGDESLTFNSSDGLTINADVGITFAIDPKRAPELYKRYSRGIEEIRDIFVRNIVRDAFVAQASKMPIGEIYGEGKETFLTNIIQQVQHETTPIGINVDRVYLVGNLHLPEQVVQGINAKIAATQLAQQRENEVAQATAQARTRVAQAEGEAAAILKVAEAQAQANKVLAASLTPELIQIKTIEKWTGQNPTYIGGGSGNTPFIIAPAK